MSARSKVPELADNAVRAPVHCRFMVSMRDSGIAEAIHETALCVADPRSRQRLCEAQRFIIRRRDSAILKSFAAPVNRHGAHRRQLADALPGLCPCPRRRAALDQPLRRAAGRLCVPHSYCGEQQGQRVRDGRVVERQQ